MTPRLLVDENASHRLVTACRRIVPDFPIVHIADWERGAFLSAKDPVLLATLRDHGLVLVGFDRASMPVHAARLSREGVGHAGIILFRRSISLVDYGAQARLLVSLWAEGAGWDWSNRVESLPRGS